MTDLPTAPPAGKPADGLPLFGWLASPLLRKAAVLLALLVLFLFPIELLRGLIDERAWRAQSVHDEVGRLWGPPQTVIGPILAVPVVETTGDRGLLLVLPERLTVMGKLNPEERRRGLFKTLVYGAELSLEAGFRPPTAESFGLAPRQMKWDEARLVLAASDFAGITGAIEVQATGEDGSAAHTRFRPGTLLPGVTALEAGVAGVAPGRPLAVAFPLTLAGSGSFAIVPAGEATEITLAASWPHPSFGGAGLPQETEIDVGGFRAVWRASAFAEGLPPAWHVPPTQSAEPLWPLRSAALQVGLIDPVDDYLTAERAVKYALFVLGLIYAAVFLFEMVSRTPLHPMQYILVGAAQSLFYLLLLSLSEVIGFDGAYWIAAVATGGLIALYLGWGLRSARRGLAVGGVLVAVHAYLYVTLGSEDFALLSGSLALFLLLAGVMVATRRLDWYAIASRDAAQTGMPADG